MIRRSIRWRLVAGSVLLSLITVAFAGVLAQSLVARAVHDRVAMDLRANAQAIAARAMPLMWRADAGPHALPLLHELAWTSSFLADARVTIVDADGETVVDSGHRADGHEFMLMAPRSADHAAGSAIRIRRFGGAWDHRLDFVDDEFPFEPGGAGVVTGSFTDDIARLPGMPLPADDPTVRIEVIQVGDGTPEILHAPSVDAARLVLGIGHPHRRGEAIGVDVPIGAADNPIGYVRMAGGEAARDNALATTRRAFGIAALVASLLAAGLGLVLGHGMSARLRDLTLTAGRMSGGDMGARAEVRGDDEIGELASRFNDMADRLQSSFAVLGEERDALRLFIADASHELRTPITALRSFNDLLSGAAVDDPAARAEFVAESAVQIDRLAWITGQLLDLSRLDAGLVEVERESVDVGDLLEAAAAAHRPIAMAAGVALDVKTPEPPITIVGDQARLEIALSNLIDNALKYGSDAGGRVVVDAMRGKSGAVAIRVTDEGRHEPGLGLGPEPGLGTDPGEGLGQMPEPRPGPVPSIPPEERERIFARFERGSGSKGTSGSGLGLAIVRSIARAHGGDVRLEQSDEDQARGARFAMVFDQPPDSSWTNP